MANKLTQLINEVHHLAQQGITLSSTGRDVQEYIELAADLFNTQFYRMPVGIPRLDKLEIAGPTGLITVYATDGRRALYTQQAILEAYVSRVPVNVANGVAEVRLGPHVYAVPVPPLAANQWTGTYRMPDSMANELLNIPASHTVTNKCSCDMFTLMNSGCKCGGA